LGDPFVLVNPTEPKLLLSCGLEVFLYLTLIIFDVPSCSNLHIAVIFFIRMAALLIIILNVRLISLVDRLLVLAAAIAEDFGHCCLE
jgi:hypothetical protein